MSNIYVKWNELSRASDKYHNCAKELKKCADRVNSVRSNLRISDEVAAQIRASLNKESEQIGYLSEEISASARSLAEIAKMYRETEQGMLKE